jgi:mannonate dehydratase
MPDTTDTPTQTEAQIQPALRFNNPTAERLRFASQLGVENIIVHPYAQSYLPEESIPLSMDAEWSFEELVHLRSRIEDAGHRLGAIENLPRSFYEDIMLGREGRDEQLEHVKTTIRNMGRADIPILGYNWTPNRVWRSSLTRPGRGGATSTAFNLSEMENAPLSHGTTVSESAMWDHYRYFLKKVLPVAEEAGVTLCLHPDDPPVPELGGIARPFRSFENLKRAMELVPSDNHEIELGLGVISEMDIEESVVDVVKHFAEKDEISYVHFRDVEGTVPSFREVFIDEGNYDEYEVLQALIAGGFEGMIIPDHVPQLEGEADWQPSGRAFTIGYIQGMLKAYNNEYM